MTELWWYLIFPILCSIVAARILRAFDQRKKRLAHRLVMPASPVRRISAGPLAATAVLAVCADETVPVDPWAGNDDDSRFARALREIHIGVDDDSTERDRMHAIMCGVRAGLLDESPALPPTVVESIVIERTYPRALTTVNATPVGGERSWSEIPSGEQELALEVRHAAPHAAPAWRDFDPEEELRLLKAARTDPTVAAMVTRKVRPIVEFVPVPEDEVAPEFAAAQAAFNARRRRQESQTIEGEVVAEPAWHTGLTTAHRLVPALGDAA